MEANGENCILHPVPWCQTSGDNDPFPERAIADGMFFLRLVEMTAANGTISGMPQYFLLNWYIIS
jgi:hypothetical protein